MINERTIKKNNRTINAIKKINRLTALGCKIKIIVSEKCNISIGGAYAACCQAHTEFHPFCTQN